MRPSQARCFAETKVSSPKRSSFAFSPSTKPISLS